MKSNSMLWMATAVVSGLFGLGCGSSSTSDGSSTPTVTGLAVSDSVVTTVSMRDSSSPAIVRTTSPDAAGAFTIDATDMRPPFFLKAQAGSRAEYAIAFGRGTANVNPVTTAACAGASENEESEDGEDGWSGKDSHASEKVPGIMRKLDEVLQPLFELYGIKQIGEDSEEVNTRNVRALLRDVSFTVKKGVVTVTNKATGGVIFTAPLRRLSEGTFVPGNMPPGPGGATTCTSFTYSDFGACQPDGTQARTVLTSSPTGCTGGSPVLTQACTYVPPANVCTSFTYSAFGACQPDGTQTRTVLTSSPAGCTGGSPVLTQACTYVPSCTLATAVASCSACHAIPPASHVGRPNTCATCHGPVANGTGTPSLGMGASLTGTTCTLTYPTGGTHDNSVVNFGAAQ